MQISDVEKLTRVLEACRDDLMNELTMNATLNLSTHSDIRQRVDTLKKELGALAADVSLHLRV